MVTRAGNTSKALHLPFGDWDRGFVGASLEVKNKIKEAHPVSRHSDRFS